MNSNDTRSHMTKKRDAIEKINRTRCDLMDHTFF